MHLSLTQILHPRRPPLLRKLRRKGEPKYQQREGFKVRAIAQPMPINPTLPMNPISPIEPTPTAAMSTATTQMTVTKSAATSIPVTVYNLAQGKFKEIHNPNMKFQEGEGPSTS